MLLDDQNHGADVKQSMILSPKDKNEITTILMLRSPAIPPEKENGSKLAAFNAARVYGVPKHVA